MSSNSSYINSRSFIDMRFIHTLSPALLFANSYFGHLRNSPNFPETSLICWSHTPQKKITSFLTLKFFCIYLSSSLKSAGRWPLSMLILVLLPGWLETYFSSYITILDTVRHFFGDKDKKIYDASRYSSVYSVCFVSKKRKISVNLFSSGCSSFVVTGGNYYILNIINCYLLP